MSTVQRAIDCLINVDMGDQKPPDWMVRVKEDTFRADDSMFRNRELPELIEEMDEQGGARAILLTNFSKPSERALRFVEKLPERFALGVGGLDKYLYSNAESFFFDR